MLKLYPLFSGSSGNMYLIKSPKATLLVDIGVSFKSLTNSLEVLNINLEDIDALLITHEHIDHTKGLSTFINKTNIPIYTTEGTKTYLMDKLYDKLKSEPNINTIDSNETFTVKDITIDSFEISHDAVQPVGFSFRNDDTMLTIATDLGYVSDDVFSHLEKSNFSVLECNYDRNLLMYGNYPYPLKCRIQSDIGHLSNDDTSSTILDLAKIGKRNFLLGHISQNNNEPDQALFEVNSTLKANGFDLNEFNISCATRNASYEEYIL